MSLVSIGAKTKVRDALAAASLARALSIAFGPNPERSELSALAGSMPGEARLVALCDLADDEGEVRYQRVLGPGGSCSPHESDHLPGRTIGGKGAVVGDVAAFYRAFCFDPRAEIEESPDHLSIELSFLGYLKLKEAAALHDDLAEEAAICREAAEKFVAEHVAPWMGRFTERLESAGDPFYRAAAELLKEASAVDPSPHRQLSAPDDVALRGVLFD